VLGTAIGGVVVLLSMIVIDAFISSPPTRAEFDVLKVETSVKFDAIKETLDDLKTGQENIINHVLQRK